MKPMRALWLGIGLVGLAVVILFIRRDAERAPTPLVSAQALVEPPGSRALEPSLETSVPTAARSPQPLEPPRANNTEPELESATDALVIRARLIDPRGTALAGGRLTLVLDPKEWVATGDERGEVELSVPRAALAGWRRFDFHASAPPAWRALKRFEGGQHVSSPLHLGEIQLSARGILTGLVIDDAGAPVAGAFVISRPPPVQSHPFERYRLFGGTGQPNVAGADGTYRLDDVEPGWVEVVAGAPNSLIACSDPLDVVAEVETSVPPLVLRRPADHERIAGRFLDVNRQPVAGRITLLTVDEQSSFGYYGSAADGTFEILAPPGLEFTLLGEDPHTRGRRVKLRGVRAGDRELELVLDAAELEFVVRDAHGPVDGFRVQLSNAKRRPFNGGTSLTPGVLRLARPNETFFVNVNGPGHQPEHLGPFEPASAPARIEVVLTLAGGIEGTVLANGEVAPDLDVHAHHVLEDGGIALLEGDLLTFLDPRCEARTETDEGGRFFLPLTASGSYVLHASRDDARRAALEFVFAAGSRVSEVVVELPATGGLGGRVLVAPGVDPRGTWIGATDGDGHVELTQCDEAGAFHFGLLPSGLWQVLRVNEDQARYLRSPTNYWEADDGDRPPWSVRVASGATAVFDIDARDEIPCTLEGRLTFSGTGARGLVAYVGRSSSALDGEGRFTLRASQPGSTWLTFTNGPIGLATPLELHAGANTFELDLHAGTVSLENLLEVPIDPRQGREENWPDYALVWRRGDLLWTAALQAATGVQLEQVPAGTLTLRWREDGAMPRDFVNWPLLQEFALAPGESKTVRAR